MWDGRCGLELGVKTKVEEVVGVIRACGERERESFSNLIFQASMHAFGLLVSTFKADTFGLELYN